MKYILFIIPVLAILFCFGGQKLEAKSHFHFGLNLNLTPRVFSPAPQFYYAPQPVPVYVQPAPVYYAPQPVPVYRTYVQAPTYYYFY